jgi:catechol 2,3-dioxygenase-like lactoylglutathione lyase family enzyme
VGINHVALEVGHIEDALGFYGGLLEITGVEREPGMAFVDLGDQFLAFAQSPDHARDRERHFGLVVDDRDRARAALRHAGVPIAGGPRLNFRDPWGNQVQVVQYSDVQFTKAPEILRGMGLARLEKHPSAVAELREKGFVR